MKYKARFLYDIYEEKYAIIPYYSWGCTKDGNWHLADEHVGRAYSVGYKARNVMRYIRIKEKNVVLHEEEVGVLFSIGNKIEVNGKTITIKDVVKKLDGFIDYYIDEKEYIPINTYETYFDERPKQNTVSDEVEVVEAPKEEKKSFWENFWKN